MLFIEHHHFTRQGINGELVDLAVGVKTPGGDGGWEEKEEENDVQMCKCADVQMKKWLI